MLLGDVNLHVDDSQRMETLLFSNLMDSCELQKHAKGSKDQ